MPGKFYLLFTQIGKLQPKMYKTMKSVAIHQTEHPEYKFREYENESVAKNALMIYKMEHQKYLLNERQLKVDQKISNLKQETTQNPFSEDKVGSGNSVKNEKIVSQNAKTAKTITPPKQDDSGFIKPLTVQQLQEKCKSIQDLTPSMSKLLYFFTPTPVFQPINPSYTYGGHFDGCSKSNPGRSGVGYFLTQRDNLIFESCWPVGIKTNNQAEFLALLYLLVNAYANGVQRLSLLGDSKLVVDVVNGQMKASNDNIVEYADCTRKMIRLFPYWKIEFVQRMYNTRADKLSNEGSKKKLELQKFVY